MSGLGVLRATVVSLNQKSVPQPKPERREPSEQRPILARVPSGATGCTSPRFFESVIPTQAAIQPEEGLA